MGTGVVAVIVIIMSTSIYFSSGGSKEFNLGEGNNVANIKESTGIHLIEVDASNNDGWSWLEIGFTMLALKTRAHAVPCSPLLLSDQASG